MTLHLETSQPNSIPAALIGHSGHLAGVSGSLTQTLPPKSTVYATGQKLTDTPEVLILAD